jgi:uncharacterized protein
VLNIGANITKEPGTGGTFRGMGIATRDRTDARGNFPMTRFNCRLRSLCACTHTNQCQGRAHAPHDGDGATSTTRGAEDTMRMPTRTRLKADPREHAFVSQPGWLKLLVVLGLVLQLSACESPAASLTTSATESLPPLPTVSAPTIPGVASRLVHFLTSDSVQLGGWMYGRGRTVVVCSEEYMTGDGIWTGSGIAQRLVAHGYMVLAYDFRGVGDSSGSPQRSLLDIDLRAAISFASQQGATRIVLLGASMGGTASLKVAGTQSVAAVITLSAPQAFGVTVSDGDLKTDRAPVLFVNSEGDTYASATVRMYGFANPPKQIHLYPGSAHGVALFHGANASDLSQRILSFLTKYAPPD